MNPTRISLFVVLLAALGCARQPSDRQPLTGPTPIDANVVYDSSVQWDATQLGRVVVENSGTSELKLTLIVWKYQNEDQQFPKAVSPVYTINPGAIVPITVGLALECGSRYQRDLYTGGPYGSGVTLSDVSNSLYAAPGALFVTPPCGQTPPVNPPPVAPTCAALSLIRFPYPPAPDLLRTRSVQATFTGSAIIAWGDGTSEPILSGVVTTHSYLQARQTGLILVTATVTTSQGCSASVGFES